MHVNLPYAAMTAPLLGPQNPFASKPLGSQANTLTGHVEAAALSDFDFRNQQRTFATLGYARDPSNLLNTGGASGNSGFVGDAAKAASLGGASALELRGGGKEGRATAKSLKQKREGQDGSLEEVGDGGYVGPWGGWKGEKIHVAEGVGPTPEEIRIAEQKSTDRKKEEEVMALRRKQDDEAGTEKSVFHGESLDAACLQPAMLIAPLRRQVDVRLPRPHIHACAERRRLEPARRAGRAGELHPEDVHPYLGRAHEGRQRRAPLPRQRAPHAQWQHGHQDQGESCVARTLEIGADISDCSCGTSTTTASACAPSWGTTRRSRTSRSTTTGGSSSLLRTTGK
jgi:hypothetical protein